MISSVSVYPSYKITSIMTQAWKLDEPNNYFYLLKNMSHVFLWLLMCIVMMKFPYQVLEKYVNVIYGTSIVLMVVVLIVGETYNGAKWRLNIPWVPFSIQPVEFAKIALILFLAWFLKKNAYLIDEFYRWFIRFFAYVGALFLLLVLQPDFGSILIIMPVVLALFFVWGWRGYYIGMLAIIAFLGAVGVYSYGKMADSGCQEWQVCKNKVTYISRRMDSFFTSSKDAISKKTIAFQTEQWLIAIGSGGFWWLGFGKSIQKFGYLPEAQGDFIFSVIVEELWFLGSTLLISLYLFIVYRGFHIAMSVKDLFGRYVAFGVTFLIFMQAFINIGVNLNIIPLTWITLPFVSYGWSSLMSLLLAVWILLNISRSIEYKAPTNKDPWMRKRVIQ